MPALRFCRSCAGPRPRAARRCPWCLRNYEAPGVTPEHLFAVYDRPGAPDRLSPAKELTAK